jgi:hypothetical protein
MKKQIKKVLDAIHDYKFESAIILCLKYSHKKKIQPKLEQLQAKATLLIELDTKLARAEKLVRAKPRVSKQLEIQLIKLDNKLNETKLEIEKIAHQKI